jgi:hypothetical protein
VRLVLVTVSETPVGADGIEHAELDVIMPRIIPVFANP